VITKNLKMLILQYFQIGSLCGFYPIIEHAACQVVCQKTLYKKGGYIFKKS